MINDLLQNVDKIYIAYGATDFRKQIDSLCMEVKSKHAQKIIKKALKSIDKSIVLWNYNSIKWRRKRE